MEIVGPLEPGEIKAIKFDFSSEVDSTAVLSMPTVTCKAVLGVDPAEADVLLGMPTVVGQTVVQKVQPGLAGREYLLQAWASDDSGLRHRVAARMQMAPES